ncbi:hypothetical protein C8R44DRAFT_33668 [Mycena epipterygia]|nr:hypothetical protein C8R44DRAFT_33668 [Mycena epipterygia]
MFALRRAPLRLATSVPFSRPPRIAGFSDQAAPPNPFAEPESTPFDSPPSPSESTLAGFLMGGSSPDVAGPTDPFPHDYANPFATKERAPPFRFHCHSTRNNTINTFADPDGNVLAWFSGGSCGFKKRNRSTYEAGYQCAVRMFAAIEERAKSQESSLTIDLFCKGYGQGREALFKALATAQGEDVRKRVVSLTDRTPLKIGGTRARKMKRR